MRSAGPTGATAVAVAVGRSTVPMTGRPASGAAGVGAVAFRRLSRRWVPNRARMPSGSFAIWMAPMPNRMSATYTDVVPSQLRNVGTQVGQWKPLARIAGNSDALRPAMTAAPGRRMPHSATDASQASTTVVLYVLFVAWKSNVHRNTPPSPATADDRAKMRSFTATSDTPDV